MNVYQIVTDRIIEKLKAGIIPWKQPWTSSFSFPKNLVSKKEYRGLNVFLLASAGYRSPFWVSYKQAVELGGTVRRGEHGFPAIFWKILEAENQDDATKIQHIPMLRYYTVFNVEQCDGIPANKIPAQPSTHKPIIAAEQIAAEQIVANMPKRPAIETGPRACYSPIADTVTMPDASSFASPELYYSVLFHELTHSTGHESRCSRKCVASSDGEWSAFGSAPYAREELVAEMGAAFLCAHAGIVDSTIDTSAAYIANWLQRLSDDPKLVVQAAANAQRAADFIRNVQFSSE